MVEQVSTSFGPPDILVNAAGVNFRESAENITLESWDKTLAINLRTPFFLAQSLFPEMRRKGWGRIINLASLQSRRAFSNSLAYGASKGGVDQLTRAMGRGLVEARDWLQRYCPRIFPDRTDLFYF